MAAISPNFRTIIQPSVFGPNRLRATMQESFKDDPVRGTAITHMRSEGFTGLHVAGYYLPVRWREFVYRAAEGSYWIDLVHPNRQATKHLRVILASVDCDFPGLIGLEAMPHGLDSINGKPSFFVTTSTGNLRRNLDGDLLGDQLLCVYPQPDLKDTRLPPLNFPLPSPPYTAPPGTTEVLPPEENSVLREEQEF